jgi:hypothetical protein
MPVRERDQGLVAASIVPVERPGLEERRHEIEQALESLGRRLRCGLLVLVAGHEEHRGRELIPVAGDDRAGGAHERWHGVFGEDLARLVENDDVEVAPPAEKLAHRQRARHPAGPERREDVGRLGQKRADRKMPRLLRGFSPDERVLLWERVHRLHGALGMRAADASHRDGEPLAVEAAELVDEPVLVHAGEAGDQGVLRKDPVEARARPGFLEEVRPGGGIGCCDLGVPENLTRAEFLEAPAHLVKPRKAAQGDIVPRKLEKDVAPRLIVEGLELRRQETRERLESATEAVMKLPGFR